MILQSKNIKKIYPNQMVALRDISFNVHKGEFIGIMGPSGSGKTTLLNILGSIDRMTSGKLIIKDKDLSQLSKIEMAKHRRDSVGFIFQDYNFLDALTIEENIILPLTFSKKHDKDIKVKAQKLISDFNIEAIRMHYPSEVSGGQLQRAAACRALITDPEIILADEPTGNLDSKNSRQLLEMLEKINRDYGRTIIMVTHDVFAASYCHRVLIIKDGCLINEINQFSPLNEFQELILKVMQGSGGVLSDVKTSSV